MNRLKFSFAHSLIAAALILAPIESAFAHARIMPASTLPPRSTNAGLKSGPCGGVARTNAPTVLQAGATITVNWEETINHPGRYEWSFSESGDANFQIMKNGQDQDAIIADTQNGGGDLPHRYTTTLKVPNVNCTACTIRMIQVMTENPVNPSLYYSCADVQITGATAPPAPTPVPTPPPGADVCE